MTRNHPARTKTFGPAGRRQRTDGWPDSLFKGRQKPAADGTVEAWGRSGTNPVVGWYGLKKGLRGRFGMYVPPVLEVLGLGEVEHNPKNNRMRALARRK